MPRRSSSALERIFNLQKENRSHYKRFQPQSQCLLMIGLAGSHGPWISFLYLCSPMSHQLVRPMARLVSILPRTIPMTAAFQPPPEIVMPSPPLAPMTTKAVNVRWPRQETCRRCRRKTGKRPKTSMLNSVRLKTCVVDGSRDAKTVDAESAAFVDREAGNLKMVD